MSPEAGRREHQGVRRTDVADRRDDRLQRLVARAVLKVEEIEVGRATAGPRERRPVLGGTLRSTRTRVGGAGLRVPPAELGRGRDPREDVDDADVARAVE